MHSSPAAIRLVRSESGAHERAEVCASGTSTVVARDEQDLLLVSVAPRRSSRKTPPGDGRDLTPLMRSRHWELFLPPPAR